MPRSLVDRGIRRACGDPPDRAAVPPLPGERLYQRSAARPLPDEARHSAGPWMRRRHVTDRGDQGPHRPGQVTKVSVKELGLRSSAKAFLLGNPNYFGTMPTHRSGLREGGLQHELRAAHVRRAQPDDRPARSRRAREPDERIRRSALQRRLREYVRFFVSYDGGATWTDAGMDSFAVHDSAGTRPLDFAVNVVAPMRHYWCLFARPALVRAILSWNPPPTAGDPDYTPSGATSWTFGRTAHDEAPTVAGVHPGHEGQTARRRAGADRSRRAGDTEGGRDPLGRRTRIDLCEDGCRAAQVPRADDLRPDRGRRVTRRHRRLAGRARTSVGLRPRSAVVGPVPEGGRRHTPRSASCRRCSGSPSSRTSISARSSAALLKTDGNTSTKSSDASATTPSRTPSSACSR